jgi:dTDP-4-amino-4,6-dideoxygalactose transaminase
MLTTISEEAREEGIDVRAHYHPLHQSSAERRYCRVSGDLPVTD